MGDHTAADALILVSNNSRELMMEPPAFIGLWLPDLNNKDTSA